MTTSYGVNGFTDEIFEALSAYGTRRVLIAYDRDDAGERAAGELARDSAWPGIGAYRALFPKGMDANEYARKVAPASQSLALLVKSAEWMCGPTTISDVVPLAPSASEPTQPTPEAKTNDDASSLAARSSVDALDFTFGDRHYRVRGLEKNMTFEQMKVVLRVERAGVDFLDTVDLVSARQRAQFVKQAAVEMGVKEEILRTDIGKVRGAARDRCRKRRSSERSSRRSAVVVSVAAGDEREALELLRGPDLAQTNHRRLRPLRRRRRDDEQADGLHRGGLAQARRAAGGDHSDRRRPRGRRRSWMRCSAACPEEELVRYSAITGQALFYIPRPRSSNTRSWPSAKSRAPSRPRMRSSSCRAKGSSRSRRRGRIRTRGGS